MGGGVRMARMTLTLLTVAMLAGCGSSSGGPAGLANGLMSSAPDGAQSNGFSKAPTLSADGQYVMFDSVATDLVSDDTDNGEDVMLRDRLARSTGLVSVSSDDIKAIGISEQGFISADASRAVFASTAGNLVADGNGFYDVFLRDLATGATSRVSNAVGGGDGDGPSTAPSITPDGGYVLYRSRATNLVAGDTNNAMDIFLYDTVGDVTGRVSLADSGGEANGDSINAAISDDGRYVVFDSSADNLVAGDVNGVWDVFLHDRSNGTTRRLSEVVGGSGGNGDSRAPSISGDGSHVVFYSAADNLVNGDGNLTNDVFLYRLSDGFLSRISVRSDGAEASGDSRVTPTSAISADGGRVAFFSAAHDLTPVGEDINGTNDVFVHDVASATTTMVSLTQDGFSGNHNSDSAAISADGKHVAFHSYASNLVTATTTQQWEIFAVTLSISP